MRHIEHYKSQIKKFLLNNGWELDNNGFPNNNNYYSFYKDDNIGIEMDDKEVVLINDIGG